MKRVEIRRTQAKSASRRGAIPLKYQVCHSKPLNFQSNFQEVRKVFLL